MCGDDPIERDRGKPHDPTATPKRLHRCEACRQWRLGVAWFNDRGNQALCPRCARDWKSEPPLRKRVRRLELGRRNLWKMPDGS